MKSKKKYLSQNQSFEEFIKEQVDYNLEYVEWDKIIDASQNKYLAFIDIIGFQHCLKISDKSAVKMLLMLNRGLKKIFFRAYRKQGKQPIPYQIYTFSDCAYIVFDDNPLLVISHLVQFLHLMLGLQAKLLKDKWSEHVTPVLPRISLTYGKILSIQKGTSEVTKNLMDNMPTLIGTPIAIAYSNEKYTPPFGLFIDRLCIDVIKKRISLYENPLKYSVLDFLFKFDQPDDLYIAYRRDNKGMEFPWLLMNLNGELIKDQLSYVITEGKIKAFPNDEAISKAELLFKCDILIKTIKIFHRQVANKYGSHSIELGAAKNYIHLERMVSDQLSIFLKKELPTNNI